MKTKIISIILLALVAFCGFYLYKNYYAKPEILNSRIVMEKAEQIVREDKPAPVQSSRFYAVVATDYYNNFYSNDSARKSVDELFATSTLRETLTKIVAEDDKNSSGFTMKKGPEYWDMLPAWTKEDKLPFSPAADKLSRFVLNENFAYQVPTPPVYGSQEFKTGLAEVKNASDKRTPEQGALINFWGGVPGTEAPAGIWQNRLFEITKKYNLSDRDYAYAQMILAQSVADSFVECWKTKYIFQTKRPDMTDKSIVVAMPNPPFPSYVSGHSTISFTAATVLARLFPDDADHFMSDAKAAKDSRLHAGIHFSYDNDEGEKLGRAVGEFVIGKLNLREIK